MLEFYNEAAHIDYPLIAGFDRAHDGGVFDGNGILDLQITVGPDTTFIEDTDLVTWTSFNAGAPNVVFIFNVAGVGLINFTVPLNSPYGFATSAEIIISSKVVATGVLVTSDLSYFAGLAPNIYTFDTAPIVEPTLITSLRGAFVTEVVAANSPRRRPLDCCEVDPGSPPSIPPIFTVDTFPTAGDIVRFSEGFNCYITLSEVDGSITIGSRVGAGDGKYDGVPILIDNWSFQTEPPYKCNDFISSINGVEARSNVLRILASSGLSIVSDSPNNKLIVSSNNRATKCEEDA